MCLIFATDIHHGFRAVADLLARTEAEITILAGDLVSRAFYRYETAWRFMELQQTLERHRNEAAKGASLYDVALALAKVKSNRTSSAQSQEYLKLADHTESFLRSSYDRLEHIFRQFPHRAIYVLPGNYDLDLKDTSHHERGIPVVPDVEDAIRHYLRS